MLIPHPRAHACNRVRGQKLRDHRTALRLLLFVFGDDAAAAMRTLPVALLEVSARVSDLFTTVLARHRDMLIFRHVARITETCLECILGSAEGKNSALAHSYPLTAICRPEGGSD